MLFPVYLDPKETGRGESRLPWVPVQVIAAPKASSPSPPVHNVEVDRSHDMIEQDVHF